MKPGRIYFKDNPWPEGHPIKAFVWSATEVDGDVWFDMHLESADYDAEHEIENDEDEEDYLSDWESPSVWGNYHSCTLSSNKWHDGGFWVCATEDYNPEFLDGLELFVDSPPGVAEDHDDLAFHIYLLGHDAVANHRISFERIGDSMRFRITWSGRIAQAYIGNHEFEHEFSVVISAAEFPRLPGTSA